MNRIKIIIPFVILFLISVKHIYAQTSIISGIVYELIDGEKVPVTGANVVYANSQNRFITGVTTDFDGRYVLRIPQGEKGSSIIFSFIGFVSQKIPYENQSTINVVMKEDTKQISDVVVSASYTDRVTGISEKQQTAATQRINMEEIMSVSPVTTVGEALQGQLGGIDLVMGGDPGSKSSINIRGISTLNANSDPLIVIDGIPYNTSIGDDFNFSTATDEDFGTLLNIAPTDIESIEVLKDAAATAIWGTKGGNGVLVITTKRGSTGKTRINVSSKLSTRFEPSPIPLLNGNEYVAFMQDAIWNTANATGVQSSANLLELLYNTPEINYVPDWRYFDEYNVDTDWLSEVRRPTLTVENNIAMTGGGDKATYRFSAGYSTEEGTTVGTGFDRFTSTLKVTYRFTDRLRVGANFTYTQSEVKGNRANVRSEAMRKMPNKSPYWIDEDGNATDIYFSRQSANEFQGAFNWNDKDDRITNFNPVAMANEGYSNTLQNESRISFDWNYNFFGTDLLTYSGWAAMQLKTIRGNKYLPQVATGVTGVSPYSNRSDENVSDNVTLQIENKLMLRKNWDNRHNLIAVAILRTNQSQNSSYHSAISGVASSSLVDPINEGTVQGMGSGDSEGRTVSAVGNVHYTFMDRYMITGTINVEGNSTLGRSERFGAFPALGFAWHAQEEPFLADLSWLNQAKIRLSYGESGNSPGGSYPYVGSFEALSPGYVTSPAIRPIRMQLDNLKWETSREYNLGADLHFMDARLKVTFDWYKKTTSDLLQKDVSVPASTGYTTISYFNSGRMRNSGVEFRFDYDLYRKNGWVISVNANVSRNINKILELPVNLNQENYSFGNGNYAVRLQEGVAIGSFFGYRSTGVYDNLEDTYALDANGNVMRGVDGNPVIMQNGNIRVFPGDAKYEDINNDGVINQYDIVYLGNAMPTLTGGGGINIRYKDWGLTALFHGRAGQKVVNRAKMNSESMYGRDNQSTAVLNRWRNEGDQTDIPRALYNYGYNYLGSDRFVEDASYLRLKTLTVTYRLPKKFTSRLGINSGNVFISGYDLFTWTKYTGQDPEVRMPSKVTDLAEDNSSTPISRRFACGVNINF